MRVKATRKAEPTKYDHKHSNVIYKFIVPTSPNEKLTQTRPLIRTIRFSISSQGER